MAKSLAEKKFVQPTSSSSDAEKDKASDGNSKSESNSGGDAKINNTDSISECPISVKKNGRTSVSQKRSAKLSDDDDTWDSDKMQSTNSVRLRKSTGEENPNSVGQNTSSNAVQNEVTPSSRQGHARSQPIALRTRNEKDVTFMGLVVIALLIFLAILTLVVRRVLRAYPDVIDKSGLKNVFD